MLHKHLCEAGFTLIPLPFSFPCGGFLPNLSYFAQLFLIIEDFFSSTSLILSPVLPVLAFVLLTFLSTCWTELGYLVLQLLLPETI